MRFHLSYRKVAYLIARIPSDLINEAVHQGVYPDSLKVFRDTPIHKFRSKFDFKNYRPKSVLPFLNQGLRTSPALSTR